LEAVPFRESQDWSELFPLTGHVVDLRSIDAGALAPLLAEETALLWEGLRWQSEVAEEGRQGIAWVHGDRALGYLALASNGQVAHVHRLFAARGGLTEAVEAALLHATVQGAFSLPGIQRLSGGLLTLSDSTRDRLLAHPRGEVGIQLLMAVTWAGGDGRPSAPEWTIESWQAGLLAPISLALMRSYAGSPQGPGRPLTLTHESASQLLGRVVEHRDCGRFEANASFVARDSRSGDLLGFALSTRMGPDQGHVAQLAVVPEARNQGIGTALLARALGSLQIADCRATHLMVASKNHAALALYHRLGFREFHRFPDLQLERPGSSRADLHASPR
jgi:ribosomal protein S18 acetylase RimI-like enzyme